MQSKKNGITSGFFSFFEGLRYIHEKKLYSYVLIPGLLSIIIVLILLTIVYIGMINWITEYIHLLEPGIIKSILSILGHLASIFAAFFFSFFIYRSLLMIIIIPFLGPLLSRLEMEFLGHKKEIPLKEEIKNLGFSIWMSMLFLIIEIGVLLVSLFLGPLSPLVLFFMESYLLGRGSFDYLVEKDYPIIPERKKIINENKKLFIGSGVASFLIMFIPIYGWLMAPAASLTGLAIKYYDQNH